MHISSILFIVAGSGFVTLSLAYVFLMFLPRYIWSMVHNQTTMPSMPWIVLSTFAVGVQFILTGILKCCVS